MKFTGLKSASLPDTSDAVKLCVNLGQWTLFSANAAIGGASFFLNTGKEIYALNERGSFLQTTPINEDIVMSEVYYFCDMPQPESLDNALHFVY